jgi:hypothetical protein
MIKRKRRKVLSKAFTPRSFKPGTREKEMMKGSFHPFEFNEGSKGIEPRESLQGSESLMRMMKMRT